MTTPSYKKLFSLEIQLRTIAAILFLITEKIAGKLLRVPETALGYYTLAFLCALILLCLVRRIGDSPMVHDLEEICFYDVLLAPLGLFMQQIGQSDYLFFVLADAIVLLKIIRLIWWGKNQQGELAASWPVFGILGFFRKNRFIEDLSLNHKKMVYLACGLSIVVATVLRWAFGPDFGGTPYLIFGLVALIKVIKPITHDIITTTEQKEAAERERGALERQAEIDANIKERNADLRQATHDMLGPVRAVNTIATSILASSDIAEVHQAARHIKNGLTELDDLMREVVVMSQIVTQLKTANDEIIDMGKLGDYFQLYLAPIAIERNIHLTVDDAPYKVMSNAWLLKRIIYNLLMNAINHGDKQTFVRLYLR
ncbi:MAG: hypothetical protein RL748_1469, partial [Pseudomonadota bacterium]